MQDLGTLPGGAPLVAAFSTNGDGNMIVGNVVIDNNAVAVIRTPNTGFRSLADVLRDSGTDLADWQHKTRMTSRATARPSSVTPIAARS